MITDVLARTKQPRATHAFGTFTVRSEAKTRLMPKLRSMGINGLSLFPDAEGLARSVREWTQWTSVPYELPRQQWPLLTDA